MAAVDSVSEIESRTEESDLSLRPSSSPLDVVRSSSPLCTLNFGTAGDDEAWDGLGGAVASNPRRRRRSAERRPEPLQQQQHGQRRQVAFDSNLSSDFNLRSSTPTMTPRTAPHQPTPPTASAARERSGLRRRWLLAEPFL